jgi:nucleolar complex protein 2
MLKRWVKAMTKKSSGNRNAKINSLFALLIQKLEANTRWIEEKRTKIDFAPNNRAGVDNFLKDVEWEKSPLGAYVAGQRKAREQKQKQLEDARKQDEKKRKEYEKEDAEAKAEVFEEESGEMEEDEDLEDDVDDIEEEDEDEEDDSDDE